MAAPLTLGQSIVLGGGVLAALAVIKVGVDSAVAERSESDGDDRDEAFLEHHYRSAGFVRTEEHPDELRHQLGATVAAFVALGMLLASLPPPGQPLLPP